MSCCVGVIPVGGLVSGLIIGFFRIPIGQDLII